MHPAGELLLLLLLLAANTVAQRPQVKFGGCLSQCGPSSSISISQRQVLTWWANYTNTHGGINVGGVIYDIELIIYNDAFDVELSGILYERLASVDKAHVLFGPLGNTTPAFLVSRKYQIPIINIGDYSYYSSEQAPYGDFDGWAFSAVSNAATIADECYSILKAHGVNSISSAWTPQITGSAFDVLSVISAKQHGLTVNQPVLTLEDDLSNVDHVIATLKTQNADAFSGTIFDLQNSVTLMDKFISAKYIPSAMVLWVGPSYQQFRTLADWRAVTLLYPANWAPSLNYTDKLFGSSEGFYMQFKNDLQREPDSTDTTALYGVNSLKLALENAGSLNGNQIREALVNMDEDTFYGRANFSGLGLQQSSVPYYCFQVDQDGNVVPVSPDAPNAKQLLFPAKDYLQIPAGYYPPSGLTRSTKLALGLGISLGVLVLIIAAIGIYMVLVKYQLIFIPKNETSAGEW